ncbi:hypothetical protein [Euzebya tangerina]|uniref:hypothetical protein n=1 Tax=Euzebya tangerina TaxID=591198 RepID=UPI000E322490|nr:hypothetical protein [Euzebya tangerina]
MGYRGKVEEQSRARELRADGQRLADIAEELGVSKASVSVWVRDVPTPPIPRRGGGRREPNVLQRRKASEIEAGLAWGRETIGVMSDRDLLIAGTALYAGEGAKRDGMVQFANTDRRMIGLFCRWLRHFFDVDEQRLRVRLYLHEGLDLDAATAYWSLQTAIPPQQFGKPYRAVSEHGIRHSKHEYGCPSIRYSCAQTHRRIAGLMDALLG